MLTATALHAHRATHLVAIGLLALMLCAACGAAPLPRVATSTLASPPSPAAPPIPTPPLAAPLSWAPQVPPVTAPAGSNQAPALAVAQSDGSTAYLCAPTGAAAPTAVSVWVTRDRGAHWAATTRIAVTKGRPLQVANCSLFVDANQPGTVVVRAGALPLGGCVPFADCVDYVPYVSVDAGAHWSRLQGPLGYPQEFATRGAVTYALFSAPPRSASPAHLVFVKSTDGMRTWTDIAAPLSGGSATAPLPEQVARFWLNPFSGALLTMSSDFSAFDQHFWSSADGTHWVAVNPPPFAVDVTTLVVQQPFTSAPWRICLGNPDSYNINGQTNAHMRDIACTADGGAHWSTRHLDTSAYTLLAIADDGDLLFTVPTGLERFAIGLGGVDALGSVPDAGTVVYAASGGAGVLWAGPANNFQDADPQGRVFTASYA